jgi:hypothetical protein
MEKPEWINHRPRLLSINPMNHSHSSSTKSTRANISGTPMLASRHAYIHTHLHTFLLTYHTQNPHANVEFSIRCRSIGPNLGWTSSPTIHTPSHKRPPVKIQNNRNCIQKHDALALFSLPLLKLTLKNTHPIIIAKRSLKLGVWPIARAGGLDLFVHIPSVLISE